MKEPGQPGATGRAATQQDTSGSGDGSIANIHDLFLDQLRDIYNVECQLIPALAELESMCASDELQRLFRLHIDQTRRQKERLEKIGRGRGWDLGGDTSKAMEGLIAGGREHVAKIDFPPARDFLIVAHSHRIEHYELAAYAVTIALADRLGHQKDSELLNTSLKEEQAMDESLTRLAAEELMTNIPAE